MQWSKLLSIALLYSTLRSVLSVDGGWSRWSGWSKCSVTCGGGGNQRRYRSCDNPKPSKGGKYCDGGLTESRECEANFACPVDGMWSDWTAWSICSTTCGQGIRSRRRSCDNPIPIFDGKPCEGAQEEIEECSNLKECPRDGGWTPWSSWSPCSATCGDGKKQKSRSCNNPPPAADGKPCEGQDTITRNCVVPNACPVNGQWSEWSVWSHCSTTCGSGQRQRIRSCDNPPAQNGGEPCSQEIAGHIEIIECKAPVENCPVDGGWSEWSEWGLCETPECGNERTPAYAFRQRSCNNPLSQHGGYMCKGSFLFGGICVPPTNCRQDGGWSEWSEWKCSIDSAQRTRACDNPPPSNGGKQCPPGAVLETWSRTNDSELQGYNSVCGEEDEEYQDYDYYKKNREDSDYEN